MDYFEQTARDFIRGFVIYYEETQDPTIVSLTYRDAFGEAVLQYDDAAFAILEFRGRV